MRSLRLLAAAVLAGGAAALLPARFTRDVPQRATIVAAEDADAGTSRWLLETDADRLPDSLRGAARFRPERPYPWAPGESVFAAPAAPLGLAAPELRVESDETAGGTRRIRGKIVSPRGAPIVRLAFAPAAALRSIAIGGVPVPALSPAALRRGRGWKSYACVTTPPGGIDVAIEAAPGPVTLVLSDRSPGLPPAAAALASRRGPAAVPSQSGDGTMVMRRVTL
jgi:hypothetical protein